MYAIVRTGGKQYQVSPGDVIRVEKIAAEQGEEVALNEVLLVKDDDRFEVGTPILEGASVKAKVLEHGRAKKIIVFKFKRRKQYRRKQGHRQDYTRLQIQEIVSQ
ncbi:MAG: 50S ribosomal protein L21 [Candidatus Omnitrophica bacterium]|nr:50S ribosomal protein L21 [Candidatus Omnitrophota bacterium]